jgi:hypothetical protein
MGIQIGDHVLWKNKEYKVTGYTKEGKKILTLWLSRKGEEILISRNQVKDIETSFPISEINIG